MIVIAERVPTRSHRKAGAPRPCFRVQNHVGVEMLPPTAFAMNAAGTRRRSVCNDCLAREKAERQQRHEQWQSTFVNKRTGKTMRRCSTCRKTKELADKNYSVERRNPDGSVRGYSYVCKPCASKRQVAMRSAQRRDPATAEQVRARQREYTKRWRARNPEYMRQLSAAYRARVKADPVRYARRLEAERIAYHLRAERRGRATHTLPNAVKQRAPEAKMPYLPAEPLLRAVEDWLRRNERFEAYVNCGVDERTLRRWREDLDPERGPVRMPQVQFDAAERALAAISLHLWEVWPEDEYPALWRKINRSLKRA